jgi:hypothetical protein
MRPHSRGTVCPRVASRLPSQENKEGAGNAGCSLHPWPRVQQKARGLGPQVQPEHSSIPCADGFNAYSVLSPATNSSCHRRQRIRAYREARLGRYASADLAPATGVRTTRLRVRKKRRSSCASDHHSRQSRPVLIPTRAPLSRPPHSEPNARDDRDTPLFAGRNGRGDNTDLRKFRSGIFFAGGLDRVLADLPVGSN